MLANRTAAIAALGKSPCDVEKKLKIKLNIKNKKKKSWQPNIRMQTFLMREQTLQHRMPPRNRETDAF